MSRINLRHVFSVPWSPSNVVYRSFLRSHYWPGCRNCLRVSMAAREEEILDKLKGRDLGFPGLSAYLLPLRRGARIQTGFSLLIRSASVVRASRNWGKMSISKLIFARTGVDAFCYRDRIQARLCDDNRQSLREPPRLDRLMTKSYARLLSFQEGANV